MWAFFSSISIHRFSFTNQKFKIKIPKCKISKLFSPHRVNITFISAKHNLKYRKRSIRYFAVLTNFGNLISFFLKKKKKKSIILFQIITDMWFKDSVWRYWWYLKIHDCHKLLCLIQPLLRNHPFQLHTHMHTSTKNIIPRLPLATIFINNVLY